MTVVCAFELTVRTSKHSPSFQPKAVVVFWHCPFYLTVINYMYKYLNSLPLPVYSYHCFVYPLVCFLFICFHFMRLVINLFVYQRTCWFIDPLVGGGGGGGGVQLCPFLASLFFKYLLV